MIARAYSPAAATYYLTARNAAGQWWAGSSYAAYDAGQWASYAIAATSTGGGWYAATLDDATASYDLRRQLGASPATSDPVVWAVGLIPAAGGGGPMPEPGADAVTIEIRADGQPVADAQVWITRDAAGAVIVAGPRSTASDGRVTLLLDAGVTYHLWMQRDGVESIRGQAFVAEAD